MPFFNPLNAISIAGIPVNASGKADEKHWNIPLARTQLFLELYQEEPPLSDGGTLSGP